MSCLKINDRKELEKLSLKLKSLKSSPSSYAIYQAQEIIMTINRFVNVSKSHTCIYEEHINLE